MKLINLLKIILLCGILPSCGNYIEKKMGDEVISNSQIEVLSADFKSIKTAFLTNRCISCHQQYDNYEGVVQELTAIQSAIASDRMPKTGGPLNTNQKAIFAAWAQKGSPEVAGDVVKLPSPRPLEANWKSINQSIITPKCLVCHNPQGQAKFLDLSSRQVIFNNRDKLYSGVKLIDFDAPEDSYLVQIITDPDEPMPPVWSNISRLKDEEVKIIKEWISLGLP